MRYIIFLAVLTIAAASCKKNTPVEVTNPPAKDTTDNNDTLPVTCGCLDTLAYNYDTSFACNDTSQCYYATDKLSGVYAGDHYYIVIGEFGNTLQETHHPDTVVISKVSSNQATYQDTYGSPFTFYVTSRNPNDIEFHYMSNLFTGYLVADSILSWSYTTTTFDNIQTTHGGFSGVRIQ